MSDGKVLRNEFWAIQFPVWRSVGRISIYEQASIIGNRSRCGHFINTPLKQDVNESQINLHKKWDAPNCVNQCKFNS